jgi:hypothetical protein
MKCYWFVVSGSLLYSQGFTISGARNRLDEGAVFEEVAVDKLIGHKSSNGLRMDLQSVIEMLRL